MIIKIPDIACKKYFDFFSNAEKLLFVAVSGYFI
jgi:hypothetical protein